MHSTKSPGFAKISAAFLEANHSQNTFVFKGLILGQMLREQRASMSSCHDDKSSKRQSNQHTPLADRFAEALARECPQIPWRSAYRRMEAAVRVIAVVFNEHHSFARTQSVFDGETLLISEVLQMPMESLTGEKRQFRQRVDAFSKDKTMAEILTGALDGTEPAHNIELVANGREKGGRGGNRRAYGQFVACHFKEMSHIFQKWDKLQREDPGQFSQMTEAIRAMFLGGPVKIGAKGRPADLKPLPRSAAMLFESISKERLKRAD